MPYRMFLPSTYSNVIQPTYPVEVSRYTATVYVGCLMTMSFGHSKDTHVKESVLNTRRRMSRLKAWTYKYSQSSRQEISVWVRGSVALVHKVQKVFWVAYMSENNKPERLNVLIILNILAKILFWCEFQTADPSIFEYLSHQCTMMEFSTQACHQEVLKTEIETDHSVCSSTNTAHDFRGLMMVPV